MKKYLLNYFNEDLINEVLNSNKYKRFIFDQKIRKTKTTNKKQALHTVMCG